MDKILIKTLIIEEEGLENTLEYLETIDELPLTEVSIVDEYLEYNESDTKSALGLISTDENIFVPKSFICAVDGFLNPSGVLRLDDEIIYLEINKDALQFYKRCPFKLQSI